MIAGVVGQAGGFSFSPGTSLIALFIPLLLIVPGLVAVRTGLWTARRENPFTQLETLVVSALVSLASLLLIYIGFSVWLWKPAVLDNLQGQSLPWYIAGYCIHIVVTAAIGIAVGSFAYNYLLDNEARSRYDPWQYVFRQLTNSATIEVRTASGLWIRGHLTKAEASTGTRDLLLTSATVLGHTPEDTQQERPGDTAQFDEEAASTGSALTKVNDRDDQSAQAEDADSEGIDWENIDNSLDEEFKTDEEVKNALKNDSAGYLQLDGSAIEAVQVPDGPAVNTDEVYEELSDADRVHKRAALLGEEFGYFIIEDLLRNSLAGLNRGASRWAVTGFLWIAILAVTFGSVGILESDSLPGMHRAALAWIGLLTGISMTELLRYHRGTPMQWRNLPVNIGALTLFIASAAVVEWWVVGEWAVVVDIAIIVIGLLGGVTVGTVLHHLRDEYTATVALAVTAVTTILLASVSVHAFSVSITPVFGQTLVLVGVASLFGLFCERIRVGQAGAYEDWATVLADIISTALGVVAAGLGIWSMAVATSTGQTGYLTAVVLGFLAILAGGVALHGADETA